MGNSHFVPESKIDACSNNVGFEYERKVTLLTALSAALNFEDFEMNTNIKGYTPLDDIELKAYKKGQETLYLVQIKHVAKSTEIQDNFFFCKAKKPHLICEKTKGPNFCLNRYNSKYKELSKSLAVKKGINFIFYTNYQFYSDKKNCTLFTDNVNEQNLFAFLLNTSTLKQSYKLHENKPELSPLAEDFRKNSSFFFNQQNVDDIDNSIIHLLKQLNISEDLSHLILGDLIHYIDNICSEINKRPKITKQLTLTLLYFICLYHLKMPISEIQNNNFENTIVYTPHLWNYLKTNKVILQKQHLKHVQGMIFNHENLNNNNNDVYLNILFKHKKFELKSFLKNYFVECFRGHLPLLIENQNYNEVINILNNFDKFQVIFIDSNNSYDGSKFKDLSSDFLTEIFNIEICQKNRKKCLMRDILTTEQDIKDVLKNVKVSDFLDICSSSACLKDVKERVELERFVYFNEVETTLNDLIINHLVVLVNCNFSKIELIKCFNLTISQKVINNFYDPDDNQSRNLRIVILSDDNYEILRHQRNYFENQNILFVEIINQKIVLKDYLGSIEGIKFQNKNNCFKLSYIPEFYQNNKLIIFSGVPGIGKSIAMNQLSSYISSITYVLLVNLGTKHEEFNKLSNKVNCLEILKALNNERNSFYVNMFEFKYKKRELCVIFDGYDEIAPTFITITNTLINCILQENIQVILTTRTVLESQVESEFFSKSLILRPFNTQEQTMYLERYFSKQNLQLSNYDIKNLCKSITEKISNNIIGDEKFYSVPLHLGILSQVLLNLFQQNQFDLSQLQFEKLQIYKRFVGTKIKSIQEKTNYFNIYPDEIKKYHQYFALKEIFPYIKVPGAEEYVKVFTERLIQGSEKTGILTNDVQNMFIHRTIAEYYIALWLMENIKDNCLCQEVIKNEIYKKEYQFINDCLNSLLYGETTVYSKIISGEFDTITQKEIHKRYDLDRNIFHMLIINLDTNIKSKLVTYKLQIFFKRSVNKLNTWFKEKDYLQLTPIKYAEKIVEKNDLEITIKVFANNLYFYFNQTFHLLEFLVCKNITISRNSSFNFRYGIDIILFAFNEINASKYNFIFLMETLDLDNNELLIEEYKDGFTWLKDLGESINNLHYKAIDMNSLQLSKFLLEKYNDNSVWGNITENPLTYAFVKTSYDFIKLFIENENFFKSNTESVIFIINQFIKEIIMANNEDLINYLINKNLAINDLKIFSKLKETRPELLNIYKQFLVKEKEDKLGNSILHLIFLEKYNDYNHSNKNALMQLLKCLIENECNVNMQNIDGKTIFDLAIQNNDFDIFTFLINFSHNNFVQTNHSEILKLAILKNNVGITNLLLQNKFDVNTKDEFNDTPLSWAVQNEDCEMVRLLINSGAMINASNNQQQSPLHIAAGKNNEIEITKILLDKGADIEAVDEDGWTPLMCAVYFENVEMVELLINSGARINTSDNDQESPLHIAAQKNKEVEVTKILLEKGSNIEAMDEDGLTPFLVAVYFENLKIVQLLINSQAKINTCNYKHRGPLHIAAETNKEIEVAKILLMKGANIEGLDEDGWTPLTCAVYFNNLKILKLLINSGARINTTDNYQECPLHIAAQYIKEIEVTKILLENGANTEAVDEYGCTPLLFAVNFENLQIVKLLINSGAKINTRDNQQRGPLHIAAKTNKEKEVTKILLENGANVEDIDENGWTPLRCAVYFENLEIVKILINSRARINRSDNKQRGPLHIAAEKNKEVEVSKILLENGANIEAADRDGGTPLMRAVYFENLEIVKFFIHHGARINRCDNKQRGPLHVAAETNYKIEVMKILLGNGANIEAVDGNGYTPLLQAVYFENLEIVKLLINSGANINASNNQQGGPLHIAAKTNKEKEVIKTLLGKGANIEGVDEHGWTPLLSAVYFENVSMVKLLINCGAKINTSNNQQSSALHIAAQANKKKEIMEILLKNGGNIGAVDKCGRTPFMCAINFENLEMVGFLRQQGAYLSVQEFKSLCTLL